MRRVVTAVIIAATALVPSSAGAQDEPPASLVQQVIAAADSSLGEESTVAVLRAADRGYDLLQLIEGLLESSVAVDGVVTDDEAAVIAPTPPPAGVIAEIEDELESGIEKTTKRLDKRDDLGERAEVYDTSVDVFTMLTVLVLIDSGYSIEQIILDGFMARGVDIGFDGSIVILNDEGRVLRPDGDEPAFGDDVETANAVNTFIDDVTDAISGEDPLALTDGSFKRQYTLTINVDFVDDEGSAGTIKGKVNFGEIKDNPGHVGGRGTGILAFENKVGCSLSEFNTTKYPYSLRAPLRLAFYTNGKPGAKVDVKLAVVETAAATVTASGDSICLDVVRDTADVYTQFITIPIVTVRLRDGETGDSGAPAANLPINVNMAVSVKEI